MHIIAHPIVQITYIQCSVKPILKGQEMHWSRRQFLRTSYTCFVLCAVFAGYVCAIWTYLILTHWGWVTHTFFGNLTTIGSDNSLSPGRHKAILWTNAGILLIRILRTNFSEILSKIHTFSLQKCIRKIVCEMSAILPRPQCVNLCFMLYVLTNQLFLNVCVGSKVHVM